MAKAVKIDSAQPRILDNDQGLLVGFAIEGSEVNGRPATKSLENPKRCQTWNLER